MLPDRKVLGRRLSAAIALRGVDPADLASEVGISRSTLWRYTTGRTAQPFCVVAKIALVLNIRLDYLASGKGDIGW